MMLTRRELHEENERLTAELAEARARCKRFAQAVFTYQLQIRTLLDISSSSERRQTTNDWAREAFDALTEDDLLYINGHRWPPLDPTPSQEPT